MSLSEREYTFEGYCVHCWEGGAGFPILMLHGSGPGASTTGNWRLVLEPLAERYRVLAVDLVGFGLSGRKAREPYFDFDLWLAQAEHALELLGEGPAGIVGHSVSAALALKLAARHARVTKVLGTGAMGTRFRLNEYLDTTWSFPETRDELRRIVETLVCDRSVVSDGFLDARMKILHAENYGPYFRAMFAGDKQRYIDAAALSGAELAEIGCDVLLVHGREDLPIPLEETAGVLARAIPRADLLVLARCGHSPALEQPRKLLDAARMLFG